MAHGHNPHSQYHLPEIGQKLADNANRDSVAERCAAPAGHKTMAVDLALIPDYDEWLTDLERSLLPTAKHHAAQTLSLVQTVPGIGTVLRLVLLYDIHDIARFASVPDFVSSCRLVTGAKASAGKRVGTSGKTIGNVPLTWAFADAATLCLRNHAAAQSSLARGEKKPGTGNALTSLAPTRARAVYYMLKRPAAFAMARFLQGYGSSAGELSVSRDTRGMRLYHASALSYGLAARNATGRLGRISPRPGR